MPNKVYYDVVDRSEAEEPFLGAAPSIKKPWRRSLLWIAIMTLHWTAFGALCLLSLVLYAQVREVNAKIAERVYCKSLTLQSTTPL